MASFGPTYLTALSVIQGVALADLGSVVSAAAAQFTATQWLMAMVNMVILICVWDAYTTQSTLWDWIPDIRDGAIPFAFGAAELALNHTIAVSLAGWLVSLAVLSGLAAIANWYGVHRAREEPVNAALLAQFAGRRRTAVFFYTPVLCVALLGLAALSRLAGFEASHPANTRNGLFALLLILSVAAAIATYVVLVLRNTRRIVAYAREAGAQSSEGP